MDPNRETLNYDTHEDLLNLREKIAQSGNMILGNIPFEDHGQLRLTIDNTQKLHSLFISEKLLLASDKQIIIDRLLRLINNAIVYSSMGSTTEAEPVSNNEFIRIMSNEKPEIIENVNQIRDGIIRSIRQVNSITKTFTSESGSVNVIITGNKIIASIIMSHELLIPENKKFLEDELMETVNRAMSETQANVNAVIKQVLSSIKE